MEILKLVLVVFHIMVAAAVLGTSFGWSRLLRSAASSGPPALHVAIEDVRFRLLILRFASFMTLFTGLGLIFLAGGFAIVPKNYHVALTLMLVAIAWNLFFIAPKVKALRALVGTEPVNQNECNRLIAKLGMGTGILHAGWVALLVLMYVIL